MEIMKSTQKLKNETLQDFIESKKDKPASFAFVTPKEETDYNWSEKEKIMEMLENEAALRDEYNANIRDLDPLYANLSPLDGYIIRLMIRPYQKSSSGLLLTPTSEKVQTIRPGSHTPGELIDNPYEFDSLAVIVATPVYEKTLVPGNVVQVVRPKPEVMGDQVVHYEFGYAHPEYKDVQLPKSPKSRHFGYALIPYQRIKVLMPA
jgi:hypothetical protein